MALPVLKDYLPALKPRSQVLIHLVRRVQGLFLQAGNPKGIHGLGDLARADVRFVNRQRESGTRLLFDKMLSAYSLPPAAVGGYNTEEFTHAAVAAFVASGMADTGLGVEAAARQFDLDFIPLATERYFLGCAHKALKHDSIKALIDVLKSTAFHDAVAELPGYDSKEAGRILSITEAFPEIAELR